MRYIAGWSWFELLLVMLIFSTLWLIALPTLQIQRLKSHRADMQAELLKQAVQIQQQLILQQSRFQASMGARAEQEGLSLEFLGMGAVYPNTGEVWYDLLLQGTPAAWQLIARPRVETQQVPEDILIVDQQGQLCIAVLQQVDCDVAD
ncbi:hypothetical protein BFG52_01445 [Acinetobacter larvae]|uniref:Uncharacterized protein n=2 Tax=Acinetobacter larvae TaxID=1789224 RepID=A0A1B2LW43_9GAMM|nr:hypothetical protein BFG52_01445 [Acinetobacter larvae]